METLKKILEDYPDSDLYKFGEFIEVKLRVKPGEGCYKINGNIEQVKKSIYMILNRFGKND